MSGGITYRIRPHAPGRRVTLPTAGYYDVTVLAGQVVSGKNFALASSTPSPAGGTIGGTVYDDADGSGTKGSSEAGLSNWRVYLDADNDGVFDSGEKSVLSSSAGAYQFTGLAAARAVPTRT